MPTKLSEELHQSVSETHPQRILLPHKVIDVTLYSQQPVAFVKEFNDDDGAQIFMHTLEKKTSKKFIKSLYFPKTW